jgi:uncharacterized protein
MNKKALKKSLINLIRCIGIVVFAGDLQAASFDCEKATRSIEKLICSDPAISQLDTELGMAYKAAMKKTEDKDALKYQQRTWLKSHLNLCKDSACLTSVYAQRIEQLNSINPSLLASSSIANKKRFTLERGKQFQLCRDFLELMNRVPKKEDPNCGLDYPFDDIAKKKGFKEIDWQEVALDKYLNVLKNHYVYDKKDMTDEDVKKNEHLFNKYIQNSATRLWMAHFDANGDQNMDTVFKVMYRNCIAESGSTFLVRNDGVLDEKAYLRKLSNEFFMYQGLTYVTASDFVGEWVGRDTYGYLKGLCQVKEN